MNVRQSQSQGVADRYLHICIAPCRTLLHTTSTSKQQGLAWAVSVAAKSELQASNSTGRIPGHRPQDAQRSRIKRGFLNFFHFITIHRGHGDYSLRREDRYRREEGDRADEREKRRNGRQEEEATACKRKGRGCERERERKCECGCGCGCCGRSSVHYGVRRGAEKGHRRREW